MSDREAEFLKRLRATFRVEADEHIGAIARGLVDLESQPTGQTDAGGLEKIFRHAHSLKGAARAIGLLDVEALCQAMEEVFSAARRGKLALGPDHFDGLHRAIDLVKRLVDQLDAPTAPADRAAIGEIRQALTRMVPSATAAAEPPPVATLREISPAAEPTPEPPIAKVGPVSDRTGPVADRSHSQPPAAAPAPVTPAPASAPSPAPATPPAPVSPSAPVLPRHDPTSETIRVTAAKLDRLLLQAEELLAARQAATQRASELREFEDLFRRLGQRWNAATEEWSRSGARLPAGVEWNRDELVVLERRLQTLRRALIHDEYALGKQVTDLLAGTKELVMLPFASLAEGFPKLVRDLSRAEGKEVDLVVRGGEVEMDKRVLEEIKDPLVHLLRNAVHHGVEPPAQRARAGKPPRATLTLTVLAAEGDRVEVRIADDGAGIEADRVRDAAVRQGALAAAKAAQLTEAEAISLIFLSSVSTNPTANEVSGRGLGLAIVREKVHGLGGRVVVDTRAGGGTTFRLILPATLATFHGVLVRVHDQVVVLPTASIERVGRVRTDAVQTVENRETVTLGGSVVAWARLDAILELPGAARPAARRREYAPFVLLAVGEERVAVAVDEVLHDEEVLVKRLARPLSRVRNVAAATVLASGRVAVILNPSDLMKSARRARQAPAAGSAVPPPARAKSVLLVEDSITSRMLLKAILESAGYRVKTAADGMDGLTTLKTEDFDLVVSDVEMPRMNGFDLTASIRADKRLADKPVILVTALANAADRERGAEVGASAYIVKGSFEQSDLLEAVRRLTR